MINLDGEAVVYLINFHAGDVTGAIMEDPEGFASIYIEDQLSPMGKRRALQHEWMHHRNGDLYADASITDIEG